MGGMIETYRGAVYPWHCDHMEHMNVMWYVGKFDEATWNLFAHLGVSAAWLRDNQRGMVAVDQRLSYQRELRAGDVLAVRSGILEVSEKKVRFFHEMKNAVTNEVSAITLLTGVHIDAAARKSTPLPADVLARARELIVAYELPW